MTTFLTDSTGKTVDSGETLVTGQMPISITQEF